ncbi:MAG: hypothetical protein COV48_16370 [Elusimicrobia bacterium CG11_big_fil_rev_8_21_14_0_20_64_6]|nr:MAG: hypothetical protein COV48_16370 [Elusimicrobia bacterium CG11_big_fil_rev_8_21_14_0_20_64_6]
MSTPEQEVLDKRKKRTILLMAGGTASLILPLLGVVYLQMNEAKTARPPDSSVTFERREDGDSKIRVSQTVTIVNPPAMAGSGVSSLPVAGGLTESPAPGSGSSLDFIKGGGNNTYYQDKPSVAAATASTPTVTAPEPVPETKAPQKAVAQKGGKKAFNMPRLQGGKGFSSFKSASPRPTGGKGMTGVADPQTGKSDDDMAEMLKGIPGGVNNPEVQKYLKSQSK